MSASIIPDIIQSCEAVSRQIVAKSHAIAATLELSPSDYEHLELLIKHGSMTAGQLASLTGLTTGAITGVIDRLEDAACVERQHDATDRRRIIIAPSKQIKAKFSAMQREADAGFRDCLANYSPHELEIILTFLRTTTGYLQQETTRLRHKQDS